LLIAFAAKPEMFLGDCTGGHQKQSPPLSGSSPLSEEKQKITSNWV